MIGWHVARTEPARGLLAERSLVDEGFRVFYPKVREEKRWTRGRVGTSTRALVPGYVFVPFDADGEGWQKINDALGVRELIYSAPEIPVTIKERDMWPLLHVCSDGWQSMNVLGEMIGGFVPKVAARAFVFMVGQTVKVIEGPFSGFPGRIVRATAAKAVAEVLIFGRMTQVEGDSTMFEPA